MARRDHGEVDKQQQQRFAGVTGAKSDIDKHDGIRDDGAMLISVEGLNGVDDDRRRERSNIRRLMLLGRIG